MTILEASSATLDENSCETFTLNNQTYSSSGTYTQTLNNTAGCDSVIRLNLTILEASSATLDENSCETFTLNNQTYSSSGTFTQTLTNAAGCDSILTLNLTISQSPDLSITENGNVLTANQEDAIYQWINCSTDEEIPGETQQVFEASSAGSFAVIIINGECTDTSECVVLSTVQVSDYQAKTTFNLYPNPTSQHVQLVLPEQTNYALINIFSADGRLCFSETLNENANSLLINTSSLDEGIYVVSIQNNETVYTRNLIILR